MNNQRPFKDNLHTNFKSLELVDNINEFSISYQKQADSSKQTTWRDKHTLPAIININIKQYKKSWPEMTSLVNSYNGTTTPYNVLTIK